MRLGEGWDYLAFLVGGEWVFRFPRRVDRAQWQQREEAILKTAALALGALVPQVRYRGPPSEEFPYRFMGYRLLEGMPADTAGVPLDRLALELADVFGRLHALDAQDIPDAPSGWEHKHPDRLAEEAIAQAPTVRKSLPDELLSLVDPWLAGEVPAPQCEITPRFCHNDVSAEHVLVKPDGTIRGLIDWTDAMLTDPVVDFAGLITIAGWTFISQVLDHYPLPVDPQFSPRLQWLARTLTLIWLADAVENDENLDRHLTWITRAFTALE